MASATAQAGSEIDPETGGRITHRAARMVLRCANPECNEVVARAALSPGASFDVVKCAKCRRASRFRQEADGSGVTIILLPTQKA